MLKLSIMRGYDPSKEPPIKNFRLVRERIENGFRGKDIAEKVGLSELEYLSIEGLRYYPSKYIRERISSVLNKDPGYLFPETFRGYCSDKRRKSKSEDVLDNLERVEFDEELVSAFEQREDPINYQTVVDKALDMGTINSAIMRTLETLNDREKELIKYRFGFNGGGCTLREASKRYHITPSRVKQIEFAALKKLRHPARAGMLIDYYLNLIND